MSRILIIITLILFGILTGIAVWHDGIIGIFESIFHSFGSVQIYVDLVIALTLIMVWMWHDANATGRNPWPWIIATLLVGAFSPLMYLLTRKTFNL
jgi:RsiW-degrading membrane proteinase PrsW (M82 family)